MTNNTITNHFRNKNKKENLTASELISYLEQFPADATVNLGVVRLQGKEQFVYPIKGFRFVIDSSEPMMIAVVGQGVHNKRIKKNDSRAVDINA